MTVLYITRPIRSGFLILILLMGLPLICPAQRNPVRLPFRMANNLIILPARINGSDTLHFILDTGLKTSILCELDSSQTLDLKEAREIRVVGLGDGIPAEAIQSGGNLLEIGPLSFPGQDFIVLSDNILQLSRKMGTRIHGMLSIHAFPGYVIEIDYDSRFLSFHPSGSFREPGTGKYASLPLLMESGKPFLMLRLTNRQGRTFPVKLLLDSGASNAIWLDVNSLENFSIPDNSRYCYLGCGISGNVKGLMSRMEKVEIGPYSLPEVLVSFPDSQSIAQQETVSGRNGSVGSEILKRFDVILDLSGQKIHLRPNRSFSRKFHSDMSGMEVIAERPDHPVFTISRIREGSVADLAGARAGDRILSINKVPAERYSLDEIYRQLLGKEGKKVELHVLRGEEILKFSFRLEEYI